MPESIEELQKLAAECRAGNPAAMEQFARSARPLVHEFARQLLHGNELKRVVDASDIAQIVVERACRQLKSTVSSEPIVNWDALFSRMVLNAVIDQARKWQVRGGNPIPLPGTDSTPNPLDAFAQSGETPSEIVACRVLLQRVSDQLPHKLRKVWERRCAGKTWIEIGVEFGVKPHTLRVRLNQALDQIAKEIRSSLK